MKVQLLILLRPPQRAALLAHLPILFPHKNVKFRVSGNSSLRATRYPNTVTQNKSVEMAKFVSHFNDAELNQLMAGDTISKKHMYKAVLDGGYFLKKAKSVSSYRKLLLNNVLVVGNNLSVLLSKRIKRKSNYLVNCQPLLKQFYDYLLYFIIRLLNFLIYFFYSGLKRSLDSLSKKLSLIGERPTYLQKWR
ncbi:hypothetical protein EGR_03845 [Echinococcus granulosus]|uniref:Uncharacterized protein n=1 Tax=Echinococcus granulosus TaxID=6210 RepID=W6V539_ECHGR|nr:hypothetical protein EGR_03845 [Echinococcus granulosus]EUB61359.1 hypothetical protein EGR_03845 [Echinococcus granulosus]